MTSSNFPSNQPDLQDSDPYSQEDRSDRYPGWEDESVDSSGTVEQPSVTSTPVVKPRRRGGIVREIAETALIAIIIFAAVRALVLNFRVDGTSMFPNLHDGDMLLVNRNSYESFDLYTLVDWLPGVEHADAREFAPFDDPQRGDIIVFDPPVQSSKPYIKRIIGLPGETVEIHDGAVFINGEELDEPYIDDGITECTRECEAVVVPEGEIFVMGDNRQNSSDSRAFGTVPIDSVQGKAWVIYWPVSDAGLIDSADYPDE